MSELPDHISCQTALAAVLLYILFKSTELYYYQEHLKKMTMKQIAKTVIICCDNF